MSYFETFKTIAAQNKEGITLEKLADYLHLPVSEAMKDVFALYDRVSRIVDGPTVFLLN